MKEIKNKEEIKSTFQKLFEAFIPKSVVNVMMEAIFENPSDDLIDIDEEISKLKETDKWKNSK